MSVSEKTVTEILADLESGSTTSEKVCEEFIKTVDQKDGDIGAFIDYNPEQILADARVSDDRRSKGQAGLLEGVPVAIKDNINVTGQPTTCASKILEGYISPYDASVITHLKAAGAVLFGKTNLDEFAMGGSTENSAIKRCHNPWDTERVPGGSSGGSAAAVAASMAPAALGSDTGGSIRQPSAFCGIYGLKPTYGRLSRFGLVAFGSSLDQIGPMGRSPRDLALLMQAMAGYDPRDSTSVDRPIGDYVAAVDKAGSKKLKVGVLKFDEGIQPAVLESYQKMIDLLKSELDCETVEVELPHNKYGIPVYYLLATSEASTNLARFDGVRYGSRQPAGELIEQYEKTRSSGFGTEVKRRILLGTFSLSSGYYDAYYKKASQVRTLIRRDYDTVFAKADVLALPTTPTVAYKMGAHSDPVEMYLGDLLTVGANLAGLPAMSLPFGSDADGMPVGMQLMAPHFAEEVLFDTAARIYNSTGPLKSPGSN